MLFTKERLVHYRVPFDFTPVLQPNGKYAIRRVPIFPTHFRDGTGLVNESWMRSCVAWQADLKEKGYLPKLIIGHNPDDPSAPELPTFAKLDNYAFEAQYKLDPKIGMLYADYVDIEPRDLETLRKFPGRSAEVSRNAPKIPVVAMLGGTPSYFALPDLNFSDRDTIKYRMEFAMPEQPASPIAPAAPANPAAPQQTPEEAADFQKFCKYMQRYEAEKAQTAKAPPETPAGGEEKKYGCPGSLDEAEPNEKGAAMARMREAGELKHGTDEAFTKYRAETDGKFQALLGRVDALTAENVALKAKGVEDGWRIKYREVKGVPAGRLKIEEELETIMLLPEDNRQAYFDRSVRAIGGPSTKPSEPKAGDTGGAKPEPGSQEEADAVTKYFDDNRAKFRNFGEAQRSYIKNVRNS